jgi:hypothetical protein
MPLIFVSNDFFPLSKRFLKRKAIFAPDEIFSFHNGGNGFGDERNALR